MTRPSHASPPPREESPLDIKPHVKRQLEQLSDASYEPIERLVDVKGYPLLGTRGRSVVVKANAFELKLNVKPGVQWFRYQVTIVAIKKHTGRESEPLKTNLRPIWLFIQRQESLGVTANFGGVIPVFDGKFAAFTARQLPQDAVSFEIKVPDRGTFSVKIHSPTSFAPQELIKWTSASAGPSHYSDVMSSLAVMNTIFTHSMAERGYTATRNVFFLRPAESTSADSLARDIAELRLDNALVREQKLDQGLEVCRGFFQSVRPTIHGLIANVNVVSSCFLQAGSMIGFIQSFLGKSFSKNDDRALYANHLPPDALIKINKLLRNVVITVDGVSKDGRGAARKVKIKIGLSDRSSRDTRFQLGDDGKMCSVEDFFKQVHHVSLNFPHYPVVKVNDRVSYPLELCNIAPFNPYKKKLNTIQQKVASEYQTLKPEQRQAAIASAGAHLLGRASEHNCREFSLVSRTPIQMLDITSRILAPPSISYQGAETASVRDGVWMMTPRTRFTLGVDVKSFAVVVQDSNDRRKVDSFLRDFDRHARAFDVKLPRPDPRVVIDRPRGVSVEQVLDKARQAALGVFGVQAQLVFWIFNKENDPEYPRIKAQGLRSGIALQALQSGKLNQGSKMQFAVNVAMKINSKMGGVCFGFQQGTMSGGSSEKSWIEKNFTLVFGADVTHSPDRPSIAAVVCNVDRHAMAYIENVDIVPLVEPGSDEGRTRRSEIITPLETMVLELLDKFVAINNVDILFKVTSIVFLRDGVSEAEEPRVLEMEIPAIHRAIARFCKANAAGDKASAWCPKLTFITTVKRHHMRFFPAEQARGGGGRRNNNISPGTVVDDLKITDPRVTEYYAASHAGILGTTRPTNYRLLLDENVPRMTLDEMQALTNTLCHAYERCNRAVSIPAPVYYADLVCQRARSWFEDIEDSSVASSGGAKSAQSRRTELSQYEVTLDAVRRGINRLENVALNPQMRSRTPMWFL